MAELTRRATTLIKEMLTADGKLPVYNVRLKFVTNPPYPWIGSCARPTWVSVTVFPAAGGGCEAGAAADRQPSEWHDTGYQVSQAPITRLCLVLGCCCTY